MKLLSHLFSFKGRMNRTEYIIITCAMTVLFNIFFKSLEKKLEIASSQEPTLGAILLLIVIFLFLLVGVIILLSAKFRRLQDFNISGWWYIILSVFVFLFTFVFPPMYLIGISVGGIEFVLFFYPGNAGPNRFDLKSPVQKENDDHSFREKRIDFKL